MINKQWIEYNEKRRKWLYNGLNNGSIRPYNDEEISKLRNIYDGGIPASIILLSNYLTNGYCYDRAYLLSKAFLDSKDDIKLVYATINSLRLNPDLNHDERKIEHCFLLRTTSDGKKLVYDTSSGFVYDYGIYCALEKPIVSRVNDKKTIKKFAKDEEKMYPNDLKVNLVAAINVLPVVEAHYSDPEEKYALENVGWLQREVELFKQKINYDVICNKLGEDKVKKLRIKLPDDNK